MRKNGSYSTTSSLPGMLKIAFIIIIIIIIKWLLNAKMDFKICYYNIDAAFFTKTIRRSFYREMFSKI